MFVKDLLIMVYNDMHWINSRIAPVEINLTELRKKRNFTEKDIDNLQILDVEGKPAEIDGKPVKCQIDRIDKNDTTKDVLIFIAEVKENPAIYYISNTIDKEEAIPFSKEKWDKDIWRFQLENDRIELELERGTAYKNLAGSASNVLIKGSDNKNSHSFGKIMMQLEGLRVSRFNQSGYFPYTDYEYVSSGEGKIRTFLTLKQSIGINFVEDFNFGQKRYYDKCNCDIYRIISLFNGKDYIKEEIFIEAKNLENTANRTSHYLNNFKILFEFSPSFYTYVPTINEWMEARIDYPEGDKKNRGWFAAGNEGKNIGFGFASNSIIRGNVNVFENHFRWTVSPTYHLKCLHQFIDKTNAQDEGKFDPGHVVGSNWFDSIYKPLWSSLNFSA